MSNRITSSSFTCTLKTSFSYSSPRPFNGSAVPKEGNLIYHPKYACLCFSLLKQVTICAPSADAEWKSLVVVLKCNGLAPAIYFFSSPCCITCFFHWYTFMPFYLSPSQRNVEHVHSVPDWVWLRCVHATYWETLTLTILNVIIWFESAKCNKSFFSPAPCGRTN